MSALEVDIQTRTLRAVSVMPSESTKWMNKSANEEQSGLWWGGVVRGSRFNFKNKYHTAVPIVASPFSVAVSSFGLYISNQPERDYEMGFRVQAQYPVGSTSV